VTGRGAPASQPVELAASSRTAGSGKTRVGEAGPESIDDRELIVKIPRFRAWRLIAAATALAMVAVACGDGDGDGDGAESADSGEVTLLHAFTGEEDVAGLNAIIDAFNEEYPDIEILEEGTNDFESLARTRIGAGNAPDVILHPQPGLLEDFYNQGVVTPLDDVVDVGTLEEETVGGLLDLVTFDDQLYGIPMRLSLKSLVWYNPKTFEAGGYEIPETWDELMELTEAMAADDIVNAPWCIGIESGDATGWVATDWIEDILLRTIGPEDYDRWVAGELEFSSDEVQGAIEDYLVPIWTNDDYVFGGQEQIAREAFGTSVTGILGEPDSGLECGLHRQATFIESFIAENAPDAEFGTDYDFFYLPPINDEHGRPTLGAGDFAAQYSENAAANTFMQFLATPQAGEGWAALGGYLSPFAPVFDSSIYPSDSARTASDILAEADSFRFDGSDTMPGDVGSSSQSGSFWIEMTDWIQGNQSLDDALADIDALFAEISG
jgi:alpha-glucoside transport system substrate-binding protein